jgi:hypothetical protein
VEKLDINIWLLPSVVGTNTVYCDIGLKLKPDESHTTAENMSLSLGLPFLIDGPPQDLTKLFYSSNSTSHNRTIANAVFGNSALPYGDKDTRYDDGDGVIVFSSVKRVDEKDILDSKEHVYSIVPIIVTNMAGVNEANYVRLRFRVRQSRRLWKWHRVSGRRKFSVSDMRVNEFRENPSVEGHPELASQALDIRAVHCLAIFSSKLRIAQINPQPRYIRVLERSIWETYLGRSASKRGGEIFVITYWRQTLDPKEDPTQFAVTADRPFRAYLDVERRVLQFGWQTLLVATLTALMLIGLQLEEHFLITDQVNLLFPWNWIGIFGFSAWLNVFFVLTGIASLLGLWFAVKTPGSLRNYLRRMESNWYRRR